MNPLQKRKRKKRIPKEKLKLELEKCKQQLDELVKEQENSDNLRKTRKKVSDENHDYLVDIRTSYKDITQQQREKKNEGEYEEMKKLDRTRNQLVKKLLEKKILLLEAEVKTLESRYQKITEDTMILSEHAKNMLLGQVSKEEYVKKSLFCLSISNPLRIKAIKIATHQWFDYIILLVIAMNVFFLMVDDPLLPDSDPLKMMIYATDIIMVSIFLAEMFLKIIAMGLIDGKNTYLRNGWNILDLIINIVSVIGLFPDVARLSAFRTLRVLRALKAISKLKGLQVLVNALLISLVSITNIGLLLIFLFTIFGIFAVQLWGGLAQNKCFMNVNGTYINDTFYDISNFPSEISMPILYNTTSIINPYSPRFCSLTSETGYNCASGEQCIPSGINPGHGFLHFDNLGYTFLTLFVAMSKNRWSFILYMTQDILSTWTWLYFVVFLFLCTMFAVNLMIAIIVVQFLVASIKHREFERNKRRASYIMEAALLASSHQDAIMETNHDDLSSSDFESDSYSELEEEDEKNNKIDVPALNGNQTLKEKIRQRVKYFTTTKRFEYSVLVLIIINLVVLSMRYYGMSDAYSLALDIINYILTILFVLEMILKWIGSGIAFYFKNNLNRFDFLVVLAGVIELIVSAFLSTTSGLIVLRVCRLIRMIKLFHKLHLDGLIRMINTVKRSLASIFYVTLLLAIFLIIYGLTGRQFLSGKLNTQEVRYHFDTLWWAIVSVFRIVTGDDWSIMMYKAMEISPWFSLFYMSLFIIGYYVLFSLYLGVLLSKFAKSGPKTKGNDVMQKLTALASSQSIVSIVEDIDDNKEPESPKLSGFAAVTKNFQTNFFNAAVESDNKIKGVSCFCLQENNKFRKAIGGIVDNPIFEYIINSVVIINCILLTLEYQGMPPLLRMILEIFDYIFTGIYIIEMIMKITAYSFYGHKDAYLNNRWNIPDFLVTILSIIGLVFPAVGVMKGLRSLRILRLVSQFKETRNIVRALARTIPTIGHALGVVLLLYLIFGVVGINFFGGQFWRCNDPSIPNKSLCTGTFPDPQRSSHNISRSWENLPFNFDNIGISLLTLFQVASLSGWSEVMYAAVDINGIDQQPVRDAHPENAIFFMLFIILGSFFSFNLFTSAIIHNFLEEKEKSGGTTFASKEEIQALYIKRVIQAATPRYKILSPNNPISRLVFKIVDSSYFDMVINACIFLNTVALAIPYYGMSDVLDSVLDYINYSFLAIFTLEAILKLIGLGPSNYFGPPDRYFHVTWNKFDFVLVVGSLVLVYAAPGQSLLNVMRVFRVARMIRLVRKLKSLHRIFKTFVGSLPHFRNIAVVISIVYFIYAVIGVKIMGDLTFATDYVEAPFYPVEEGINYWANFQSFPNALLTLLRISILDRWVGLMNSSIGSKECQLDPNATCGNPSNIIYYITFIFIQTYIINNLFVAILVELFTDFSLDKTGSDIVPISHFENFRKIWTRIDIDSKGYIPAYTVLGLLLKLKLPLGYPMMTKQQAIDEVEDLQLTLFRNPDTEDDEKYVVDFTELLYAITKRATKLDIPRDMMTLTAKSSGITLSTYLHGIYDQQKEEGPPLPSPLSVSIRDKYKKDPDGFLYLYNLESSESASDPERVFAFIDTSSSSLGSLESFSDSSSNNLSLVDCESDSESEEPSSDSKGKSPMTIPNLTFRKTKRIPSSSSQIPLL